MIRSASRSLLRQSLPPARPPSCRRFLSTAPPAQRSRSWKNSAVRWGLAIGGVYYFTTSNVFAEEPAYSTVTAPSDSDSSLPTLESISASRRNKLSLSEPAQSSPPESHQTAPLVSSTTLPPSEAPLTPNTESPPLSTPSDYESEASQQGAFNEETGEINWDCPCLGGMAHGPCGEQFRAAFSCFVYSKEEPKGMDCIERFKGMQDCFREHPDVYGSELDEEEVEEELQSEGQGGAVGLVARNSDPNATTRSDAPSSTTLLASNPSSPADAPAAGEETATERAKRAKREIAEAHGGEAQSESEELVPKAWHDGTGLNEGK